MQPLVDAALIELCFLDEQEGIYFSKKILGPSDQASEDGFRLPSSYFALDYGILSSTCWLSLQTQPGTFDSDLPPLRMWWHHFATLLSFFGHTLKYSFSVGTESCPFPSLFFDLVLQPCNKYLLSSYYMPAINNRECDDEQETVSTLTEMIV